MPTTKRGRGRRSNDADQFLLPFHENGKILRLFGPYDQRKSVSLMELSRLSGITPSKLRSWNKHNWIPGRIQPAKGALPEFQREALEEWWIQMQTQAET
jgi:hypothetical protein